MKKALIILSTILFFNSCVEEFKDTEPNKNEKLASIKAINTEGETEILRKVKLEKFELSNIVLTKDMIDTIDSRIEWKRQSMIEDLKKDIAFNIKMRDSNYKIATGTSYKDTKDIYLKFAKDYDDRAIESEAELKSYENKTDENPLIDYYENVKNIHLEYGDTTARIFEVVYLIDDARTTTKFSFLGKDDSTAYNQEISKKYLMSKILETWAGVLNKGLNN